MGKASYNKMMEDRISGMTYAWDFIKQNGMEAFEKELKFRKATFVQLEVDKERCDLIFDQCVTRMYNTFITAVVKVLNESYGFGGKRLHAISDAWSSVGGNARINCVAIRFW